MNESPTSHDDAAEREVLRLRARALAEPAQGVGAPSDGDTLEVLEFHLAGERYAVETAYAHGVHPLRNITRVPCTPAFISGIVNVRGHVHTVIDLKKFLKLPEAGIADLHRIILVGRGEIEFGLLADLSVGVLRVPRAELQPALSTLTEVGAHYVQGIAPGGLIVLDMRNLLTDPRLEVDESVAGAGNPSKSTEEST